MFTRILFPTDLSAYASAVLECLPELKKAGVCEVVLLSVIPEKDVPLAYTPVNAEALERVQWGVQEQLLLGQHALEGQGLRVRTRVEYGIPAREIVRVAQEEQVSLIVLGAQGQSLWQEFLLGSTAYDVLRLSTIPVLVEKLEVVRELGHAECRRVCEETFARVLHPTDFSYCAGAAFRVLKRLGAAGAREVILLHVQDESAMQHRPPYQLAEYDHQDTERLERMRRDLTLSGLSARIMLRHGVPFRETLKVAEEENTTLIVLGLYGRSAFQELFAGSTFEKIVRASQRAVLVVRP